MNLVNETFGSQMRNECNLFESLPRLSQTSMPTLAGVTFVIPIPLNISPVRCSYRQITHGFKLSANTHSKGNETECHLMPCDYFADRKLSCLKKKSYFTPGLPLKCICFPFHFDLQRQLWL